jgi:phospholipid/cholesterol/gamma-HCH transport system substrate-binding protein
MKQNYWEMSVGLITVIVSISFVIFVANTLDSRRFREDNYKLVAMFDNVEGVVKGTKVKIAGVEIGHVEQIALTQNGRARVDISLASSIKVPRDSNLKISTSGLIGGKYLRLDIGGEENMLTAGETFNFTESALDLEDLLMRFILQKSSAISDIHN